MTQETDGGGWVPDLLGDGYEARTIPLPDDAEGPVVTTVVRSRAVHPAGAAPADSADTAASAHTAVLYVHGLNDYFFQTELADRVTGRAGPGLTGAPADFYAVDLRKCGRSWREYQTPHYSADFTEYGVDLDAAMAVIRADGHDRVIVLAHSTGGLSAALWLADRGEDAGVRALMLNSPLLDLNAAWVLRVAAARPIGAFARRRPLAKVPVGVSELYGSSIHTSGRGEFDFDVSLKQLAGFPIHAGWLGAALAGIRRVHAGLGLTLPVLVLCSTHTVRATTWSEEFWRGDAVLDAHALARRSVLLGRQVTCVRIPDGMHDLLLSRPAVRETVYAAMQRWLRAYG
ncbi:alpha/beta hydrolase [Nakamurella flavida]|uniref:Alpha/beta hydrolase n=1 Tax=Nakamurella flavida TaxID=363630 RepID=A0A938YKH8_9ACTN|nr:alpha/beta hydrolase [Nakamurella flavida]MBM9476373.1 alpha/beta hydrolase [Nakamurella flavida]MDP9779527.1 alpha-beta hydrolase superfamily lysophospholipase [Nakamurella flavida]